MFANKNEYARRNGCRVLLLYFFPFPPSLTSFGACIRSFSSFFLLLKLSRVSESTWTAASAILQVRDSLMYCDPRAYSEPREACATPSHWGAES